MARDLAEPAFPRQRADALPPGRVAHHEGFGDDKAGAVARRQQGAASSAFSAIGFSHSTCLPASSAWMLQGTCRWLGSGL